MQRWESVSLLVGLGRPAAAVCGERHRVARRGSLPRALGACRCLRQRCLGCAAAIAAQLLLLPLLRLLARHVHQLDQPEGVEQVEQAKHGHTCKGGSSQPASLSEAATAADAGLAQAEPAAVSVFGGRSEVRSSQRLPAHAHHGCCCSRSTMPSSLRKHRLLIRTLRDKTCSCCGNAPGAATAWRRHAASIWHLACPRPWLGTSCG